MRNFFLALLLLFGAVSLSASDLDFLFMPMCYTTPDTGLAYGGQILVVHDTESLNQQLLAGILFTTQKQRSLYMDYYLTLASGLNYTVVSRIKDWPAVVYGQGMTTQEDQRFVYNQEILEFELGFLYPLRGYTALGLYLSSGKTEARSSDPEAQFFNGESLGLSFGPAFSYQNPGASENQFQMDMSIGCSYYSDSPDLGIEARIDIRYWLAAADHSTVAFHFLHQLAPLSASPLRFLSLGNSRLMRGIPEYRFIDRALIAVQSEYRYSRYRYLHFHLFGSAGQVFSGYSSFHPENIAVAAGVGLILCVRRLKISFELAYGLHDSFDSFPAFYIRLGDAF